MSQTKFSAEQLAAIDQRDAEFAYELGFAKLAQARGLTQEQFEVLYKTALEHLAKAAETPAKA